MPLFESDDESIPLTEEELKELLSDTDIEQWLETLHNSDRSIYNLMALEVWSIAKTMDELLPGFWNRFMASRHAALQQFLRQRQQQPSDPTVSAPKNPTSN